VPGLPLQHLVKVPDVFARSGEPQDDSVLPRRLARRVTVECDVV